MSSRYRGSKMWSGMRSVGSEDDRQREQAELGHPGSVRVADGRERAASRPARQAGAAIVAKP